MKNLMLAAMILITIPTASFAGDKGWEKTCRGMGYFAERTMTERQNGKPMASVITELEEKKAPDQTKDIVIEAYDSTRYYTEENKQRAIADFRDRWYLYCYKTYVAD